jgi:hypothetical protein
MSHFARALRWRGGSSLLANLISFCLMYLILLERCTNYDNIVSTVRICKVHQTRNFFWLDALWSEIVLALEYGVYINMGHPLYVAQ